MANKRIMGSMVILGLSGVISKSFDFVFRAYYSRILGSEGMGLLSLAFSLHGVLLTFATAGLGVAVSKTVSEYLEMKKPESVRMCMRTAIFGVIFFSLAIILITIIASEYIAAAVLGDNRVSLSLCCLAPSVLFMGISYCIKGCFYAERKILPPATSEILEQVVKFISIRFLLNKFMPYGVEYGCAAVFAGITIGEMASCTYLALFYRVEDMSFFGLSRQCLQAHVPERKVVLCRLLGVAIPSMMTSLFCSVLRTKEEVLIISALCRGGAKHSTAVKVLGVLHGMVMPLLVLPLNLLGSVMSLLVPEISRAGIGGKKRLRRVTIKIYRIGFVAGGIVAALFLIWGDKITHMLYNSDEAARIVVCLAPLCPMMFMDSLSCSILNGLGKQMRLLAFSGADFALRFAIIYFAFPLYGTSGFTLMITFSNLFTCALSFGSVLKIVYGGIKFPRRKLTKSVICGILKGST